MLPERDCLQSPYNDLIGCHYAYTLLIVILEAQNLNLKALLYALLKCFNNAKFGTSLVIGIIHYWHTTTLV